MTDIRKNENQNPFTYKGFQIFFKKDMPMILGIMVFYFAFLFIFHHQTLLVVPPPRQFAWATRLVSTMHAIIACLTATLFLTRNISLDSWMTLVNISRAYTIYDFIVMLIYPDVSANLSLDLIHHSILFFIMLYSFRHGKYIAMGLLCEITQLPFYISWYLLKWDMAATMDFKIFAALTLVTCFLFRVCLFSYITYRLIRDYFSGKELITIPEILIFVPISSMNYYWFYLLIQKAIESFC